MQFEYEKYIWFFWIVLLVILLSLYFYNKRKHILSRFIAKNLFKERLQNFSVLGSFLQYLFFILALISLSLALLKPYHGFEMREIKRQGVELYFLVDLSPSMQAQDIKPSRLMRAKFEIQDFLKILTGDKIGLIGFSGEAFVLVPLTTDYSTFSLLLNDLDTDLIPLTGTDIKGAITKASASFKQHDSSVAKAIVLITDGEDSVGLDAKIIEEIKNFNINVFVLSIGTEEGAPIPLKQGGHKTDANNKIILSKLNEAALQNLALKTGGVYVRSVSGDLDLETLYKKGIKKSLGITEFAETQKKLPHYRFSFFLWLGFLLMVLEILTTRKSRFWLNVLKFKKR